MCYRNREHLPALTSGVKIVVAPFKLQQVDQDRVPPGSDHGGRSSAYACSRTCRPGDMWTRQGTLTFRGTARILDASADRAVFLHFDELDRETVVAARARG